MDMEYVMLQKHVPSHGSKSKSSQELQLFVCKFSVTLLHLQVISTAVHFSTKLTETFIRDRSEL